MLGVAPVSVLESVGRPWMLGTDVVPRHARAIVEHGPALVAAMRSRFLRLENAVDGGNRQACRLLLWLGFRIEPAAEVVGGVPFRAFSWEG